MEIAENSVLSNERINASYIVYFDGDIYDQKDNFLFAKQGAIRLHGKRYRAATLSR